MNREFHKKKKKRRLEKELEKIVTNYMLVFDEYYSSEGSRDSAFLKDLVDALIGISAVLEVYTRDKKIHPAYALEKLHFSESIIKSCISFYEAKLETLKDGEES